MFNIIVSALSVGITLSFFAFLSLWALLRNQGEGKF